MTIGIPKGLLYYKYHIFAETLLQNIGASVIVSPDTNREILDMGVNCCVDDACLPVKVFHGHVFWLKERCDYLLIPRFISIKKKKYLCPMFCGLNDMLRCSIHKLPRLIDAPIYAIDERALYDWAKSIVRHINMGKDAVWPAFQAALKKQKAFISGYSDKEYPIKAALIGHPYIIYDRYLSMNAIKKLNDLGIGVVTQDRVDEASVMRHVAGLYKQPFWYFASRYYGAAIALGKKDIDGIIYISAFSCGIDSVVIELIKNDVQGIPLLILKIDEHTGEAGFNTRIEAFADMLKRRAAHGYNDTAVRQHLYRCKSPV